MITSCWAKLFGGMALFSMACAGTSMAQVGAPQTKGVYGGIMGYIAALSNDAATTRVYVSADSAAAVFYADVDFSKSNPFGTNLMFQAVPGLTSADNRGMPNGLAIHQTSGRLFVSTPSDGLLSCTVSSNSLVTNVSANVVWSMVIEGSRLAYVMNDNHTVKLGYGTLSAAGAFTESGSPATVMATTFDAAYNVRFGVHPTNHIVYLSGLGNTNIVRSSDSIENLSAGTVFTTMVLPDLATNWTGDRTFGFGPDGRIFVGGYNPANTNLIHNRGWELTYSDDNGVTWSTAITGGSGSRLWTTVGDPANYWVYNGSAVSTNKGVNWQVFGTQVPGSRLVSRRVVADPIHPLVLYCVTECGLGVCTNGGMTDDLDTIVNISRGIEAAVISDFDLTADKNIAWIAANGIRRATNFQGTPEWSDPKFPMGNDSCLRVAVDKYDTNGLTVYAGGTDLFKTINGGPVESNPDNPTNWTRVFNPTSNGFNNVRVSAIEADGNIVAFGLRGTASNKGALFLSTDGGSNWNEVVLHSGGVDVAELLLTREGGTSVVYAAVVNDYLTTAYGVFRINVADATFTHELTDTVNMHDLAVASDGTLYASGFDLQTNVVLYSKAAGADVWTAVPLNGYPPTKMAAITGDAPLVTMGLDSSSNEVPYMLASEIPGYGIYYMTTTSTNITWKTSDALRYPSSTQIKVLFWDDLVVGTSMGLYGQLFQPPEPTQTVVSVTGDIDGDRLADLISVTNSNWYVWFSTAQYLVRGGPYNMGISGTPVTGDIDGDGLADLISVTNSNWYVWFSTAQYLVRGGPYDMGISGTPAAGDVDGDGLADLISVVSSNWYVWFSTAQYLVRGGPYNMGISGTPTTGDIDGDGLADLISVVGSNWYVWFSTAQYLVRGGPYDMGISGTPTTGDIDGDRLADLIVVVGSNWYVWFSTAQYLVRGGPYTMNLP